MTADRYHYDPNRPLPTDTLHDARKWLRAQLEEGAPCPCCTQLAKVYHRVITTTMAADLIVLNRCAGREWFHMPTLLRLNNRATGGDTAKARYWGLLEKHPGNRDDGSKRNGWWRFTPEGEAWVHGRHSVIRTVVVFDEKPLNRYGPLIDVRQALRTRFDYGKLMRGDWGDAA